MARKPVLLEKVVYDAERDLMGYYIDNGRCVMSMMGAAIRDFPEPFPSTPLALVEYDHDFDVMVYHFDDGDVISMPKELDYLQVLWVKQIWEEA